MDPAHRSGLEHVLAESALTWAGLQVTLSTLRDDGVVTNGQIQEILHRLQGVIQTFEDDTDEGGRRIAATMRERLTQMAAYLAVDLREN